MNADPADPGARQRGHRGLITTAPAVESGRVRWQASCSCGWCPEPHTRDTNAHRALRRHIAEVMTETTDAR